MMREFSLDVQPAKYYCQAYTRRLDARLTTKLAPIGWLRQFADEYDQLLKLANEMNSAMQALPEAPVSLWIKLARASINRREH